MSHHWDEFSKSLGHPLPRRESLRRLGIALAGAVLSPMGLQTASAGHHPKRQTDLCKSFCKCRNKKQQDQCLKVCNACGKDPSRLGGSCGNYLCCGASQTSCGNYCADLANDPYNCGACGNACEQPGPYEYGACIAGECRYACAEGAVYCNGACTFLGWDANNCGACGNVCGGSTPYCSQGACTGCPPGTALCGGQCVDVMSDAHNCGGCGQACQEGEVCSGGWCCNPDCTPDHPYYPNCGNVCGDPCLTFWTGLTLCDRSCIDLSSDSYNCGACGNVCEPGFVCSSGACWDPACQFNDC
jgi:hypothetical protein